MCDYVGVMEIERKTARIGGIAFGSVHENKVEEELMQKTEPKKCDASMRCMCRCGGKGGGGRIEFTAVQRQQQEVAFRRRRAEYSSSPRAA